MKQTTLVALAMFAGLSISNAATTLSGVNATVGPSTTGVAIVDNAGVPVQFSYAAGTFGVAPDFGASSLDLSGFNNLSASDNTASSTFAGIMNGTSIDLGVQAGGDSVFVVIGNNTDFSLATEYIVLDLGIATAPEVLNAGTVGFSLESLTSSNHAGGAGAVSILRGYSVPVAGDGYPAAPFNSLNGTPGLTFGVIPEPSSALLLGLGGLGLLIRRKR